MKLNRRALRILMAQNEIYNTAELARVTGLHRNQIASLLGGRAEPTLETIGILCSKLSCTPNDILEVTAPASTKAPAPKVGVQVAAP